MNMKMAFLSLVGSLGFAFSAFAADGGVIKGSVKFEGEVPVLENKKLPGDHAASCKVHDVVNEELVVDKETKGIQWAIVRVLDVKAPEPATPFAEQTIDQKGCRFFPHALILPPNTNLKVLNSDGIAHNFHVIPIDGLNQEINKQQIQPEMIIKGKSFVEPEILQIKCDIHGWIVLLRRRPRSAFRCGDARQRQLRNQRRPPRQIHALHLPGEAGREEG